MEKVGASVARDSMSQANECAKRLMKKIWEKEPEFQKQKQNFFSKHSANQT